MNEATDTARHAAAASLGETLDGLQVAAARQAAAIAPSAEALPAPMPFQQPPAGCSVASIIGR